MRCGANGGTVAFDCKSAFNTSRSTILPGNNHQHPRSSSLNTRKPKQKLMSKRKDKEKNYVDKNEEKEEEASTAAAQCTVKKFQ